MAVPRITRRRFLRRAVLPTIAASLGLGEPRLSAAVAAVSSITVLPARGPGE
ncbi:MAG: hypothetical protein JWO85_588, partial [Candidatus Eremiobacteraeota bacterium]|nr:hypothetical protein [Candidatus Eremiobacteraeota bacterium]